MPLAKTGQYNTLAGFGPRPTRTAPEAAPSQPAGIQPFGTIAGEIPDATDPDELIAATREDTAFSRRVALCLGAAASLLVGFGVAAETGWNPLDRSAPAGVSMDPGAPPEFPGAGTTTSVTLSPYALPTPMTPTTSTVTPVNIGS